MLGILDCLPGNSFSLMTAVFINAFLDHFINALFEHKLEVYDHGILNGRFRVGWCVQALPRAAEVARLRQTGRQRRGHQNQK